MRSSVIAALVLTVLAVACRPAREQQRSTKDDARAEEIRRAETDAYKSLSKVDAYEVGTTTYELFRQDAWPTFTILHMDVRSGPVETADAVVVLGVAGGGAMAQGGVESLVQAVLEQSDDRGLCIVRGWLDGQRHVAALPMECPGPVRDELDGILADFDALTGGNAVWVLGFRQGLLRRKERL